MRWLAFFPFLCLGFVNPCGVNEFKSQETGLCCQLCPAGKHHVKDCGQDHGTECQACPKDQFTAIQNNFTSCEKCASVKCDSASGKIVKQCTPTSNSRCECPVDKYWNSNTLRCKDCKKCDGGEQKISHCKPNKDTECEKCPEGTYAKNGVCVTCSHCHKGQVVESECTILKDTVCGTVPIHVTSAHSQKVNMPTLLPANLTPEPSLGTTRSRSHIEKDDASKVLRSCEPQTFSDGVTWSLLVAVVALLCFIIFRSKVKKFVSKHKTPTPAPGAGKVVTIVKPKSSELPIRENNRKFSTLPASVTEDLASYLNAKQGKNWKYLAGLMGYNSSFTQNLELTPTEATQKLLQDWEHKSGTVFELYNFLQTLERDDASAVLLPYLTTPKSRGEEDV